MATSLTRRRRIKNYGPLFQLFLAFVKLINRNVFFIIIIIIII